MGVDSLQYPMRKAVVECPEKSTVVLSFSQGDRYLRLSHVAGGMPKRRPGLESRQRFAEPHRPKSGASLQRRLQRNAPGSPKTARPASQPAAHTPHGRGLSLGAYGQAVRLTCEKPPACATGHTPAARASPASIFDRISVTSDIFPLYAVRRPRFYLFANRFSTTVQGDCVQGNVGKSSRR